MTVASVIISSLSLAFTSWRLHKKELTNLKNFATGENKVCRLRSFISFQGWFTTEIVISVISTVALCMMTWIELFSGELLTEQVGLGIVKTKLEHYVKYVKCMSIPIKIFVSYIYR